MPQLPKAVRRHVCPDGELHLCAPGHDALLHALSRRLRCAADATYHAHALKYRDMLDREGVKLHLRPSAGSILRVVGTIDTFGVEGVQIATALMTADRPTVDRDEPSWVDHDFPWWRAFGISLVLGLLLLAVVNVRRRRMAGRHR